MPAYIRARIIDEDRNTPFIQPTPKTKPSVTRPAAPPTGGLGTPPKGSSVHAPVTLPPRGLVSPLSRTTSYENPAGRRIEELAVQTLGGYQQAARYLYKDAARAAMDDDDTPRWGRDESAWQDYRQGERDLSSPSAVTYRNEPAWQDYRMGERANLWRFHSDEYEVEPGDTLIKIARAAYGLQFQDEYLVYPYVDAIRIANDMAADETYVPGQILLIPKLPRFDAASGLSPAANSEQPWQTLMSEMIGTWGYIMGTVRYNVIYGDSLTSLRQQLEDIDVITATLTAYHETSGGEYGDAITRMYAWPVFNRAGILGNSPVEIIGTPLWYNYRGVVDDLVHVYNPNLDIPTVVDPQHPTPEELLAIMKFRSELPDAILRTHALLRENDQAYDRMFNILLNEAELFNTGMPDPTAGSTGVIRSGTPEIFSAQSGVETSLLEVLDAVQTRIADARTLWNSNLQYEITGVRFDNAATGSVVTFRFLEWGHPVFSVDDE
jgi:hypothetical protein